MYRKIIIENLKTKMHISVILVSFVAKINTASDMIPKMSKLENEADKANITTGSNVDSVTLKMWIVILAFCLW